MTEQAMTQEERDEALQEMSDQFIKAYREHEGEWEVPEKLTREALWGICTKAKDEFGIECRLPIAINIMFAHLCALVGGQLMEGNPEAKKCLEAMKMQMRDLEEEGETFDALRWLKDIGAETTITRH